MNNRSFMFVLFIASLIVRLLFFVYILDWGSGGWIVFDSQQYYDLAINFAKGKGFVDGNGLQNFYRLPGYPIFLGSLYAFLEGSIAYALLVQVLIASIVPVLIYLLALQLFPKNELIARIIGFASVFHIGFILYSGMLATESLFLTLLLLFFLAFFKVYRPSTVLIPMTFKKLLRHAVLTGLLLGLLSLVRPVGHYLIFLSQGLLLFGATYVIKDRLILSAGVIGGWFLVVGGWLLRNWLFTGYIFFHTLPGLHFLQYSAAHTYMQTHHTNYLAARSDLLLEWKQKIREYENDHNVKLNQYEVCCHGEKIALGHIKNNFPAFIRYSLEQWAKTFFALHSTHLLLIEQGWVVFKPTTTFWEKIKRYLFPKLTRWYILPFIYLDIIAMLFMFFSFIWLIVESFYDCYSRQLAYRLVPFIFLFVGITIAYGCARLRLPIEPLLFIVGGVVASRIVQRNKLNAS